MDDPRDPAIYPAAAIRAAMPLDLSAMAVVETALERFAAGGIVMPPVQQISVDAVAGQTCVKSALVPGGAHFVTKVSSIFPGNAAHGLANADGLMMLFDARTGATRAVLFDAGWLTAVRTAAAGAVAAKWLARRDSRRVAVIGSGRQARLQVEALALAFDLAEVRVHARSPRSGEALARALSEEVGVAASFRADLPDATADADIVVCATGARAPVLHARDVARGVHITAMGADAPGKRELDDTLLARADLFACDSVAQCRLLGELQDGREAALRGPPVSLGSLIGGSRARDPDAVTIADLTGLAIHDLAIAELALARLA